MKDPLDKLIVDKFVKCFHCDLSLGHIKRGRYKYYKKIIRDQHRTFCSNRCKINYNELLNTFKKIDKRLDILEKKIIRQIKTRS